MPDSNLTSSGVAADESFPPTDADQAVRECPRDGWIALELLDIEGNPVPGEKYRVLTPDGKTVEGALDSAGSAMITNITPGQCKVTFPRLHATEWRPA